MEEVEKRRGAREDNLVNHKMTPLSPCRDKVNKNNMDAVRLLCPSRQLPRSSKEIELYDNQEDNGVNYVNVKTACFSMITLQAAGDLNRLSSASQG